MKAHLLMAAAAAASILLTSTAFASTGGIPHQSRRAGDRYSVTVDNEYLMCKVAGDQSSQPGAPPPGWDHSIVHLREEGDIRCTPSMTNGSYR